MPVFLLIGAGYSAVWTRLLAPDHIDGLMKFVLGFAIPCLIFNAMASMNLEGGFSPALFASFYTGSLAAFTAGLLGARFMFRRPWEDSVVVGFTALFGNTVLMGLSIVGRAYGPESLDATFAIVALHAPFCYLVGITAMELARAQSIGAVATARTVLTAMFRNSIMLGIFFGLAFNVFGIPIPPLVGDALKMLGSAALPAALFGLGGILVRYKPEGDSKLIAYVCLLALVVHPLVAWLMGDALFSLNRDLLRSAVITSAMAPGINAYIFSSLYGRAQRVTASAVLAATALSILTASGWILFLG